MSREALALFKFQLIALTRVSRVQNRKMHTEIAATVLPVRTQFRRRRFRMYGRYFISPPPRGLSQGKTHVQQSVSQV
jgi:hypothetical protein